MEWRTGFRWSRLSETYQRVPRRILLGGREWLANCVDLLFPCVCLLCGQTVLHAKIRICSGCQQALLENQLPRCQRCAKPLPKYCVTDAQGCPLCRQKRLRFDQAIALGTYGGALREAILQIKRPQHESLCLAIGELLADRIQAELAAKADVVVPVPMHWLRKIMRGTNDAEVLAEAVGARLRIQFGTHVLRCRRPTRKQGTLPPTERRQNVRRAFGLHRRSHVEGKHILIIDDVMTTGATANELAKVLHRAGAARVTVSVVARGVGFD